MCLVFHFQIGLEGYRRLCDAATTRWTTPATQSEPPGQPSSDAAPSNQPASSAAPSKPPGQPSSDAVPSNQPASGTTQSERAPETLPGTSNILDSQKLAPEIITLEDDDRTIERIQDWANVSVPTDASSTDGDDVTTESAPVADVSFVENFI